MLYYIGCGKNTLSKKGTLKYLENKAFKKRMLHTKIVRFQQTQSNSDQTLI